jgi:hypothetical protein
MKTEAEIRQEGMRALIAALGTVEAERFVAALTRERFDYTAWRKGSLPDMDIENLKRCCLRLCQTTGQLTVRYPLSATHVPKRPI